MEVEENARYSYRKETYNSLFANKIEAYQSPTYDNMDPHDLSYTFIEVKFAPLYDTLRDELLTQYEYRNDYTDYPYYFAPMDPAPWQAKEAYQLYWGSNEPMEEYLVFWEDTMLNINHDWSPTPAQMTTTTEILHTN